MPDTLLDENNRIFFCRARDWKYSIPQNSLYFLKYGRNYMLLENE